MAGPLGLLLWTLVMAGMAVGCSGEEVVYDGLHLWITSEEPATHVRIDRIEITVRDVDDDGGVHLFEGLSEQDHVREILLAEQHNIYESPYKAKFVSGEIIRDILRMTLTGFHGEQAISFWSGNVSLNENYKLEIHLLISPSEPCTDGTHDCDPNATCIPGEEGAYSCTCNDGFVGNGTVCDPVQCDEGQTEPCGNCGTQTCTNNTWGTCVNVGVCAVGYEQVCGNGGTQICTDSCMWGECTGQGPCATGNTQPCGNCGTETCGSDSQWGNCTGQGPCAPEQGGQKPCGNCGSQTKTCSDQCQWGDWGICGSEGVCQTGVTDSQGCGNCGSQTKTCSDQCQWVDWGICSNEGVCQTGLTTEDPCGNCGTQTKTCSNQCQWDPPQACNNEGVCSTGQEMSQTCGNCGTQTKTCSDQCQWGAFGSCTGQGSCSPDQTLLCGQCGSKVCTANCQWTPCQPEDSLCDDGNPCTNDACDAGQGCVNSSVANGTPCGAGKTCQSGTCTLVECTINSDCADSKPCTKNKCVEGACLNPNKNDGIVCDADSNGCTGNDACLSGVCQAGETVTCDDGLACTVDACLSTGSNSSICVTDLKEEHCLIDGQCYNNAESFGIGCSVCDPATSQTSPTPLNNGNDCISCLNGGHCNTVGGCSSSLDCDDGDAETTADECVNGVCTGTPVVKVDNQTCNTIKNTDQGATSGVYTIDTDKGKKNKPFQAYCDMTTQGGGWTLVWKQRNHDDAVTLYKKNLKGNSLLLSESYDGTTQGSLLDAIPHGETLFKHSVTIWIHVEEAIQDWPQLNSGPSNKRTCRNIGKTTHACAGIDCSIYKHVFLDRTDPPMKNGQVSGIIIGPFHDNYGTGDWLQCGEVWCHPEKHGRFDEDCTDGTPDGKGDWMIFVR